MGRANGRKRKLEQDKGAATMRTGRRVKIVLMVGLPK